MTVVRQQHSVPRDFSPLLSRVGKWRKAVALTMEEEEEEEATAVVCRDCQNVTCIAD